MDVRANLTQLITQSSSEGKNIIKEIYMCFESRNTGCTYRIRELFAQYMQIEKDDKRKKCASQTEQDILVQLSEQSLPALNGYVDELKLNDFEPLGYEQIFVYMDRISERVKSLEQRVVFLEGENDKLHEEVNQMRGVKPY